LFLSFVSGKTDVLIAVYVVTAAVIRRIRSGNIKIFFRSVTVLTSSSYYVVKKPKAVRNRDGFVGKLNTVLTGCFTTALIRSVPISSWRCLEKPL
jgi:hypothetical protein